MLLPCSVPETGSIPAPGGGQMGGYRETTVLRSDPQLIFCEDAVIRSGGAVVPGPPSLSGVIRVGIHIGWDDKGFSLKY